MFDVRFLQKIRGYSKNINYQSKFIYTVISNYESPEQKRITRHCFWTKIIQFFFKIIEWII